MKISKSFKIYIHILLASFFIQSANCETLLSGNVVVHELPKPISELKFKDINLQEIDLTGKEGNIMILKFSATWCIPCKKEMPSLERLAQTYPTIKVFPIVLN